jgi:hypothetical protein
MRADIDITFDFRSDTRPGKDPDAESKTLRRYHKLLWSKPLPSGAAFDLSDKVRGCYLRHQSVLGDFSLSSDAVIQTFRKKARIREMIPADELEAFNAKGYTIGGMMLFPQNKIDGQLTINQARGLTRQIGDRFDLTVECIRRHYTGQSSPLSGTLARYGEFFRLFGDFRGYIEFFLLQDLVTPDFASVRVSEPFSDFSGSPMPCSVGEYNVYRKAASDFIDARNQRILNSG